MKILPIIIEREHFRHEQFWREDDLAIYKQIPKEAGKALYDERVEYEVIIIQPAPRREINGVVIPARERYPKDVEWGSHGWTCMTFRDAEIKVEEIKAKRYVIANLII